jgi:DeoR/GlpR family transcriptional regulator of sugar metabolism
VEHPSPRHRNPVDRRDSIILALRSEGFLSIADLARRLRVSPMTVRRDLQQLQHAAQLRVVYGGASLCLPGLQESGRWVNGDAADEARTARCAANLVGETDTVAIDAGRLGYEVARALPEQFRGTVVTHSLPVIQLLMSRPRPPRVVGLGGEVSADSHAFLGASTVAAIEDIRVGTLFLAPDALDQRGTYARSDAEAAVKRGLLSVAARTVVVAHHDGVADAAPLLVCTWSRVAALVTDRRPATTMWRGLQAAGVQVVVADDREHGGSGPGPSVESLASNNSPESANGRMAAS